MNIVLISKDRIVHSNLKKGIDSKMNVLDIYNDNELLNYSFYKEDIVLFDLDDFEEYLHIVKKSKIICVTKTIDNVKAFHLLKEGIKGFCEKSISPLNLNELIKTVNKNKVWVTPELMSFIITNSTLKEISTNVEKFEQLSIREKDVSKLVSKGLANKEIANHLQITERTVKAHITSIFNKLSINDRVTLGIMVKEFYQ